MYVIPLFVEEHFYDQKVFVLKFEIRSFWKTRLVHLPDNQFVVLYQTGHKVNEKNIAVGMDPCSVIPFVKLYT
jgi:hypothetical protein